MMREGNRTKAHHEPSGTTNLARNSGDIRLANCHKRAHVEFISAGTSKQKHALKK